MLSTAKSFAGRAFALALLLPVAVASNAERLTPQPFGIYLSSPPANGVPPTNPQSLSVGPEAFANLRKAETAIAVLEAERGPYDNALVGPLLEAANIAAGVGQTDEAVQFFNWALHNTRVNQGLNTDAQVPIVEQLLSIHRAAGDVTAVDDRESYLYRLSGRGRAPLTEARIKAAIRFLAWRQQWIAGGEWREQRVARDAVSVYDEGRTVADTVCDDARWAPVWCAEVTLRVLGTLYLIDYHVVPLVTNNLGQSRQQLDAWVKTVSDERLLSLDRTAYSKGVRLLERALAASPNNVAVELALADWRWFQGRRSAAREVYQDLRVRKLVEFDAPVPIPTLPSLAREALFSESKHDVTVSLIVTRSGRAKSIALDDPESLQDGVRVRVRKALRELAFRPALDASGEPVEAPLVMNLVSLR